MLKHRGPDQQGFHLDAIHGVYLGHSRLSIIDLSENGRQPLYNEDGSIVLIANGEIYNYQDIRNRLKARGHRFKSNSDSEVIIHSYEEWGKDCIQEFRGMFAYAIWDEKRRELIIARDRLGIKPLYVAQIKGAFAFASEIKAFLAVEDFAAELDSHSLSLYMEFSYIPHQTKTILQNVSKVPPGHYMTVKDGIERLHKYWNLERKEDAYTFDYALKCLSKKMSESIGFRLIADVRIGILLSGGVDSSVITVLADAVDKDYLLETFTVGSEAQIDERPFANKISKLVNSKHHELVIRDSELIDEFGEICWFLDDIIADGGAFNTYLIGKAIEECGYKVVLVGEGADEIFGGYSWYRFFFDPANSSKSIIDKILRANIVKVLRLYSMITTRRYGRQFYYFKRLLSTIADSVSGDFFKMLNSYDIKYQLPNNLLMKVDKMMMAHSIEARVPYLDHELVEFVYNLPDGLKLAARRDKLILRELGAMSNVPYEICSRPKLGFQFPIELWLSENSRFIEYARDMLFQNNSILYDIGYERFAKRFFKRNIKSRQDVFTVWRLLVLCVWYGLYSRKKAFKR